MKHFPPLSEEFHRVYIRGDEEEKGETKGHEANPQIGREIS
jgi:hypothetical protein